MTSPSSPAGIRGRPAWLWSGYAAGDLRVSDAERAEITDRLAGHYADGRLDQAEFEQRLDRAANAKTQSDLSGLLADLPDTGAPGSGRARPAPGPGRAAGRRPRLPLHRAAQLALIILIIFAVTHVLAWFTPWVWVVLISVLVLQLTRRRR